MSVAEFAVLVGAVALFAFLGWFFFGPRQARQAEVRGGVQQATAAADPMCGMEVDPASAPATAEVDGTRYWFCSTGCRDTFVTEQPAAPVPHHR